MNTLETKFEETKIEQESLDAIISLFDDLGYPIDISKVFTTKWADAIKDAYAKFNPQRAYDSARKVKDEKLLNNARAALIDKSPEFAYTIGDTHSDEELKKQAGEKFAETNPEKAYEVAIQKNDTFLLNRAGWTLVEKKPEETLNLQRAYIAGTKSGQGLLVITAQKKLLERDPYDTYKMADRLGDIELKKMAGLALANNRPKYAFKLAQSEGDEELLNYAREKMIDNLPITPDLRAGLKTFYYQSTKTSSK